MKRKLPKQNTQKNFFSKKFTETNSLRTNFEANFFYKQYITKKFHKNFSKKLKKQKNSGIFISMFKKLRKKKSVKCRLIHRF